jgi:tetratricopeptide (TPR) repeat protein
MAAIRLLRPLTEGPNPEWESRDLLATVHMTIGGNRCALGQATEALEDYKRALGVRRAMHAERSADLSNRLRTVRCLRLIAQMQTDVGQGETSLESLREARGLLEPARLENPHNVRVLKGLTEVHSATGASLYGLGRIAESLASFEQEVSIMEEVVRIEPQVIDNRANLAGSLYNIAVLRNGLGRYESSLEADFAALAIRRKLAAEFPDVPSHRLELAASLGNIGGTITVWKKDYAAALAYHREASSVLEDLTRSHPDVVEHSEYLSRSRTNIAGLLSTLGRFEEALAVGQAAGDYLEGRVRAEPQLLQPRLDVAVNLDERAKACLWLRRYAEADRLNRRDIENVLMIPESSRAAPRAVRALANCFSGLGISAAFRGRLEEAVEQYSRSIAAAQPDGKAPPADSLVRESLRNALEGRAEALARLGRLDAARADWSRLASIREPGDPDLAPLGPILIRAWSGDASGFLDDAEAAVAAGSVTKDQLVTLARAACLAISRESSNAAVADRLGATATAWLLSARADGVFANQGAWKVLIDPHFDTIAQRPEFRDLKADLTFPTQPFASETTAR